MAVVIEKVTTTVTKVEVKDLPTNELIETISGILDELKSRLNTSNAESLVQTFKLSELPVGSVVIDEGTTYRDAPIEWLVAGHDHYHEGSSVLLAKHILAFKAFDAAEKGNPDEMVANYGNNRYIYSNIHQWLNSEEHYWFTQAHQHDAPPSAENVSSRPYNNEPGFLQSFSKQLKENFRHAAVRVLEKGDDGLGMASVLAPVFLLSRTEVGLGSENNTPEGKVLELFNDPKYRKASPTPECVDIDDEGEVGESDWWWLRSPNASRSNIARLVNTDGSLGFNYAFYGYIGVRPALNLSSEIRVVEVKQGIFKVVN